MKSLQKHTGKIIIALIIALLGGAFWYADKASEQANVGIEITDKIKGNPEASVVVVEYSDFQCPACSQAAPVVADMLDQYGADVRFEYRHFPLLTIHPLALPAAKAAEAAGQQGKFFEMHDLLFDNQSAWSTAPNPTAFFMRYAEELELDTSQFKRQMGATVIEEHIRNQFNEARDLGFTGTPTFTLNGERMTFTSYQDFLDQIAAAISGDTGEVTSDDAGPDLEFAL